MPARAPAARRPDAPAFCLLSALSLSRRRPPPDPDGRIAESSPCPVKRIVLSVLALLSLALLPACGDSSDAAESANGPLGEIRLGYFANVTHAGSVYGVGSGVFQKALGETKVKTQVFNAGPAAVEAIFA